MTWSARQPLLPRHLQQREQVADVAVHAAVREQPHQVQALARSRVPRPSPSAAPGCGRSCRREWRARCASGPGRSPARRPGSGGRPRCCPSGRAAGRRLRPTPAAGVRVGLPAAGRAPAAAPAAPRCRAARGGRASSSHTPQPSRMIRTSGFTIRSNRVANHLVEPFGVGPRLESVGVDDRRARAFPRRCARARRRPRRERPAGDHLSGPAPPGRGPRLRAVTAPGA